MNITDTIEAEIRRARPTASAVAVTIVGEIYHVTVDGTAFAFECGSDDDQFVFVNDADETDTIVFDVPDFPEPTTADLLAQLNALRATTGKRALKSWRASRTALEAAIAKHTPAPAPDRVHDRARKPSRLKTLFPDANLKVVRSKLRRKSADWRGLTDDAILALMG